jgi:hypothetical protein
MQNGDTQGGGEGAAALATWPSGRRRESQRMIQDAAIPREEERISPLLHTKPSGRRRESFAILCQTRRHPGRRRGCRRS